MSIFFPSCLVLEKMGKRLKFKNLAIFGIWIHMLVITVKLQKVPISKDKDFVADKIQRELQETAFRILAIL